MLSKDAIKTAVDAHPLTFLNKFLKVHEIALDGWSKLKAPQKREALVDFLAASPQTLEAFAALHNELYPDQPLSTEDAPGVVPVAPTDDAVTGEPSYDIALVPAAPNDAPASELVESAAENQGVSSVFVEGDFQGMVADAAGLTAQQAHSALGNALNNLELEHFRVGVLLARIQSSGSFTDLGYETMRAYIEAETGMHYRKAMYLVQNAEAVRALAIPHDKLKGVSWAALRYVTGILTADNYDYWLEAARSMPRAALVAKVEAHKVTAAGGALPSPETEGTPQPPALKPKTFQLYADQSAVVQAAVEKAQTEFKVDAQGAALEAICASYTGAPPSESALKHVKPDTSDAGLKRIFAGIKDAEKDDGLLRILNALEPYWDHVQINVKFPAPGEE